jgi:beta-lactam-binding protein with PASTA domain
MATRRRIPDDFAAALDRVPEAGERFDAMPPERQVQWLDWIDRARGRRRAARIDDAIRRLLPSAAVAEETELAEPVGPPPERNWWIWLLLLLLLVVAGLLLWYFLSRGNDKTTVPNVVGMQEQGAAHRLQDNHLKVIPNTGPSTRPVGVVFAQQPGAGAQVDKGQSVTISISGGPARKPVPNVTDLPVQQATTRLTSAGFKAQVQSHASSRPKGVVFAQQPVAGVTAVNGATVILSVSTGVKPVVVPSVVGQTQGAAVSQLTKLGLSPQLQNVASQQPAGTVVAQKPPATTKVDKGSTVKLNVSKGTGGGGTTQTTTTTKTKTQTQTVTTTARATVPTVRGLAMTAGLRRLNIAGFRPVVRYANSSQRAGLIVTEAPASGSARRGAAVRVTVSNGPNPAEAVAVPDVTTQDQASAAQALRQAGLRPLVLFRRTNDQSQVGNVIEQQPAGGSIPRGSYVAIFVGRSP